MALANSPPNVRPQSKKCKSPAALYKLLVVGDCDTEKATLVKRFQTGNTLQMWPRRQGHHSTGGQALDVHPLSFHTTNGGKIDVNCWVSAGGRVPDVGADFKGVPKIPWGAIIMFDATDFKAHMDVPNWHDKIQRKYGKNIPIVIVGTNVFSSGTHVHHRDSPFHKEKGLQYYDVDVKKDVFNVVVQPFLWLAKKLLKDDSLEFVQPPTSTHQQHVHVQLILCEQQQQQKRADAIKSTKEEKQPGGCSPEERRAMEALLTQKDAIIHHLKAERAEMATHIASLEASNTGHHVNFTATMGNLRRLLRGGAPRNPPVAGGGAAQDDGDSAPTALVSPSDATGTTVVVDDEKDATPVPAARAPVVETDIFVEDGDEADWNAVVGTENVAERAELVLLGNPTSGDDSDAEDGTSASNSVVATIKQATETLAASRYKMSSVHELTPYLELLDTLNQMQDGLGLPELKAQQELQQLVIEIGDSSGANQLILSEQKREADTIPKYATVPKEDDEKDE